MATQAETLAAKVTTANAALIAAVEGCSDEDWRRQSASEGWSVGVLAHHVAVSYGPIAGVAQAVSAGGEPALPTQDALNALNARHAVEAIDVGQAETVELLRRNGAAASALVGELRDAQLALTFPGFGGQEWTVAQFIEAAVVGHPQQHLASIRAALGS